MSQNAPEKEKVAPLGVDALRVFFFGIGILVALAVALAAMVAFYNWNVPARSAPTPKAFPSPNVFASHGNERRRLDEEQRSHLESGAIPIMQAMALIAARGQSAYSPLPQIQEQPQQIVVPRVSSRAAVTPTHPKVPR
ncbi:hypothetical protein WOC76_00050 [Methylocystis sp. IM3]|uniref:hypothetical protein n=1 Tax=unclassified Methylocystis TaxID=2625913 RepID=UPI0030F9D5AB